MSSKRRRSRTHLISRITPESSHPSYLYFRQKFALAVYRQIEAAAKLNGEFSWAPTPLKQHVERIRTMSISFLSSDQIYSPTDRVLTNEYGFEVVEYTNPITGIALYAGKPNSAFTYGDADFRALEPLFIPQPSQSDVPPGFQYPAIPLPLPATCCSVQLNHQQPVLGLQPIPEPSYSIIISALLLAVCLLRHHGRIKIRLNAV